MPSHVLDLLLELPHGALRGALEDHVFEEMRGAVGFLSLEPRSGVDPNADGGSASGEGGLGSDAKAAGERGHAGLGSCEDGRVVGDGRDGVAVLEEAGVGVVEAAELGNSGGGEAVVEHWWGGAGGGNRGGGEGAGGGRKAEEAAGEGDKVVGGHGGWVCGLDHSEENNDNLSVCVCVPLSIASLSEFI